MMTCTKRLFSWDFRVKGASAEDTEIVFNTFQQQGCVYLGDQEYPIYKHGKLVANWTMESDGTVLAEALRPNPLFRRFDVKSFDLQYKLQARSTLGRTFDLLVDEQPIVEIRPAHPFTYRSTIQSKGEVHELVQLFAFWLAALTWKRQAETTSSGV